jgi:hypothetical protein
MKAADQCRELPRSGSRNYAPAGKFLVSRSNQLLCERATLKL